MPQAPQIPKEWSKAGCGRYLTMDGTTLKDFRVLLWYLRISDTVLGGTSSDFDMSPGLIPRELAFRTGITKEEGFSSSRCSTLEFLNPSSRVFPSRSPGSESV